jgi:hypothetical protein
MIRLHNGNQISFTDYSVPLTKKEKANNTPIHYCLIASKIDREDENLNRRATLLFREENIKSLPELHKLIKQKCIELRNQYQPTTGEDKLVGWVNHKNNEYPTPDYFTVEQHKIGLLASFEIGNDHYFTYLPSYLKIIILGYIPKKD